VAVIPSFHLHPYTCKINPTSRRNNDNNHHNYDDQIYSSTPSIELFPPTLAIFASLVFSFLYSLPWGLVGVGPMCKENLFIGHGAIWRLIYLFERRDCFLDHRLVFDPRKGGNGVLEVETPLEPAQDHEGGPSFSRTNNFLLFASLRLEEW
jgi:hypothetical protein